MRVLVVGSLPPPESARAGALLTEVVGLLAQGHTVEVVAPDPVATAHRYISASGIPACARLWTMVSGFDSVVIQLQPGLPVRERAGRLERELALVVLSLVLRRGRHVVIRLESLADLPGGPAGRGALLLWRSAGQDHCRKRCRAGGPCGGGGCPSGGGRDRFAVLCTVCPRPLWTMEDGAREAASRPRTCSSSYARGRPENAKSLPASRLTCPVGRGFRPPGLLRPS